MDCSAVVLNKVLKDRDLNIWAKLKLAFLDSAYSSLYSTITKHYDKYGDIPSFEELEIAVRDTSLAKIVATIKIIDEPDIDPLVALDALIDQYTQNQTISLLDKFIDKLPIYDTQEVKENLSNIVLTLDEKTLTTEGVYNMSDILLFRNEEEYDNERVYLGLNNVFDSTIGMRRQELLVIGGQRGAGKSITCSNIVVNQYEAGNTAVYFSIEMVAHETLERKIAILADVPYMSIKQNKLSPVELLKVIKVRAGMFQDADDLVNDFIKHKDRYKFETELVRNKFLKEDNQIIIIDDRALSITSIDLHLGKLKSKFKDKLKVCVVDYINQIKVEGTSQYDWQPQIQVSKSLKELARKYEVLMVSPYQIDAAGEARFAKGILDAPDVALIMEPHKDQNAISFDTTKIRGGPLTKFTSAMNWDTLRISAESVELTVKEKKVTAKHKSSEHATDIPWN